MISLKEFISEEELKKLALLELSVLEKEAEKDFEKRILIEKLLSD